MHLILKILLYHSTPFLGIFELFSSNFQPFFGQFDIKEKEIFLKKRNKLSLRFELRTPG